MNRRVIADVGADVRAAGAVDGADDPSLGWDAQADEAVGEVAEAGDQDQVGGLLPLFYYWVVEEDRACLGGDEVVRSAQDVAEDRAQVEVVGRQRPGRAAGQEVAELGVDDALHAHRHVAPEFLSPAE